MDSVTHSTTHQVDDLVWSERVPVNGRVEIRKSESGVFSVWYYQDRHKPDRVCIDRHADFDCAQASARLFIDEDVLAPLHMAQYY